MLFEIERPRRQPRLKIVFQTTFRHRRGYSATNMRTSSIFLFYHGSKIELSFSSKEERIRSICDVILKQNCRKRCSLLHPRFFQKCRQLVFFFKSNRFLSFNHRCECFYYILIRLWAIHIVDYLFFSTICFNRGRLSWKASARLNLISFLLIRNMQGQRHI